MRWVNVLHFYQPPLSRPEIVLEAAKLSYGRIAKALLKNPQAKVTVNFSGCLLEQLVALKQDELINDWRKLVERGQVELLGSAYWHALLPKISLKDASYQIIAQENILKEIFKIERPQGFFAPELAYSKELAKWLVERGYSYAIVDEITIDGRLDQAKDLLYQEESGLILATRQRKLSKVYPPEVIMGDLRDCTKDLFTATDGELYGLRHRDYRGNLEKVWESKVADCLTVGELVAQSGDKKICEPVASSWESQPEELVKRQPYFVWDNRQNNIHSMLWSLADLASQAAERFSSDNNREWVYRHLHQGLASCAWWWASNQDFVLFGNRAWNPEEIIRGAEQLTKSVRSIEAEASRPWKQQADKIFCSLQGLVWQQHWRQWLK